MHEYRLVDGDGWEWPDRAYDPEDLDGDKSYMESRHPGKGWKVQVREVTEWVDQ